MLSIFSCVSEKAEKDAKTLEEAQKQVDEYNRKWQEDNVGEGRYRYRASDLSNPTDQIRSDNDKQLPAVISSTGQKAASSALGKVGNDRFSEERGNVEVTEPDWYVRMKRDGRL